MVNKTQKKESLKLAKDLIKFLDASPTASYCILESEKMLLKSGFKRIYENDSWKLKKGDKFYIVRHNSALVAGIMGEKSPKQAGYRIIGSHTDSPCFKLKPNSVFKNDGYIQLGIEVYGGPLFSTWTDRELSLAGLVVLSSNKDNGYIIKEIDFDKPLVRIPQLAIHYNREANTAFKLNPQTQLTPILGLDDGSIKKVDDDLIKDMIAKKLKVKKEDIVNYELELYDIQKGAIGGLDDEFIFSKGIDDKSMVHSSLHSLINYVNSGSKSDYTPLIALFDNEEVGSSTTNGGNSSFMKDILQRLSNDSSGNENYLRAISSSFFISADGAHALHPNYQEKFEPRNKVYINKGPVIKINANTNYASTVESIAMFEIICNNKKIPYQKFVNRSDIRGGGTIGSMIATNLGIRTVDIGNSMMAMHSIRETCGVLDHYYMTEALSEFLIKS